MTSRQRAATSVTLADVAARAGVSPATVSRVLNDSYPVSASTRDRVTRAVRELKYVVNGHARALAASTSMVVGVIVNDVSDPFFSQIVRGIQTEAAHDGKLVVICNTEGEPARELSYLELLRQQRAHSVLLTGAAVDDPVHLAELAEQGRGLLAQGGRLVLCGRPRLPDVDAPAVTFANHAGASALARHLVELGHRRIAYLTGPLGRTTTAERFAGFREQLAAAGVPLAPELVLSGGFTRAAGYDNTRALLAAGAEFTALVTANDAMAFGALAALREHGIDVPDQVSVAGFDDLPFCVDSAPPLTTVRLPLTEAGALAARLAAGREPVPFGGVVTLQGELVVRRTVNRPPSQPGGQR
ncbi:LacI family DNA-binding transcriptional regulator [Goodfellowiella coeruleoviolacea]|uniref:Transcriptional regulator, LacI family n=1 Tax=Goodfellowiella coeruleoviolacea TaxID=334858 RepID=A0AAE3GJH3_9PSEU|nr:LacI family DNA-binding transcriptional regulator [Goodfellowiella coeruleoviolacea]MCP2169382.1 transcriptional regulator, LacI family [Goodfellowiella coeruleoviolacea]